ncbi:MAG: hypothetical protein ACP5D2_00895 [Candidatus Nanoarchaeia archaeon]
MNKDDLAEIVSTTLASIGITTAFIAGLVFITSKTKETSHVSETSSLLSEVQNKSAGEDRIWTLEEKRAFLDYFGFEDVVLQPQQQIYFKPRAQEADIYLGYSGISIDNKIGTISQPQLRDYLSEH